MECPIVLQARIPGTTPELLQRLGAGRELWESEGLTKQWGLTTALGFGNTGMELGDDMSASLVLPSKVVLLDYAQRAFAAADRAVSKVEDQHFMVRCIDLYDKETTIGQVITGHLGHMSRHLGMIEALCGVQGERGTATI
ncbi:MAG: hypothetical protein HY070_10050 [Chloroflexi bacterium]|nr:hypothetical protein [Chloroflexota bacterium]